MAKMEVRAAQLDDTVGISALHRTQVQTWQRMDADGKVQDVPYEALTIYERWLHGGAWMSVETGAIHLARLLLGAGLALVAVVDGRVVGYAEGYHGHEPAPFGDHLNLGSLVVHPDAGAYAVDRALTEALIAEAKRLKCARLTVSVVLDTGFHRHFALEVLTRSQRYSIPARTGQVFYKVSEHLNADGGQIAQWHMPVGRVSSARQGWETLWHRQWDALPEVRARRTYRLHFSAAGQEALVHVQQQLYMPRSADVAIWSPKPLTNPILSALRDWAHRENYRALVLVVGDAAAKVLGSEAEADGYYHDLYALDL